MTNSFRLGGTDLLRLLLFLLLASRRFVFLDFPFFFVSQSMFAITLILLWGLWRENQRLLCVWKTRAYLLTPLGGRIYGACFAVVIMLPFYQLYLQVKCGSRLLLLMRVCIVCSSDGTKPILPFCRRFSTLYLFYASSKLPPCC
jgi:hypothetical protein